MLVVKNFEAKKYVYSNFSSIVTNGESWSAFCLQRASNPLHVLWRTLAILSTLPYPPPFQILSNPHPSLLPLISFFCLVSFSEGWLSHIWCANLLNSILGLHMLSFSILIPEGPCCVFMQQSTKSTEVWHIMWFFAGTLIWYQKHRNTHTKTSNAIMDQ